MALIVREGYDLFAEAARLRLEAANLLMLGVLAFRELDLTVLTDYLSVRLLIMFLLVTLRYNLSALLALVVAPRATNLMHAELRHLYLSLAR